MTERAASPGDGLQPVQGDIPAEPVRLTGGPVLAVRRLQGPLRPIVLIADAGRDARDWNDVAPRLAAAGHEVAAVDLRGHGESQTPSGGYDTDTCADDLATLIELLGYTGGRSPVLAGHGWGANVAMSMAARRDSIAGLGCFDGGWLRPSWQFGSVAEYLEATAPDEPRPEQAVPDGMASERTGPERIGPDDESRNPDDVRNPDDEARDPAAISRAIRTSIYQGEPRAWYPLVRVPVLLAPAVPADGEPDSGGVAAATRTGVAEASTGLQRHRVTWYTGAGHDLPRTQAARVAHDLLRLANTAEPTA